MGGRMGGRSHTSMGGMASFPHSITAAPSPSSCCLSPFARFYIIFDHIRGEKKAERLRHRGAAGRSCIARTARLSSGSAPRGFFSPSVGVWLLELLLSGLNAAKSAWCIRFPPRLGGCARWLCQNCVLCMRGGLQGHLGSLLSSKELLGTGAGMLLGALKSSRRRKSKI